MKNILFITTRNPYSGRFSGDVIRSAKIIDYLKKNHNIDVVFLGEQNKSKSINTNMIGFKQPNFFLKIFFFLISLIKLNPIQFEFFSQQFKEYIQDNAYKYDILFFYHIRSSQFFPKNFYGKTILEMGDLYSKNYKLTYKNLSLLNPFFYFYFLESFLVKRLEKKIIKIFDKIILFSKNEVDKIKSQKNKVLHIPESVEKVKTIYKYSKKNYKILFVGNLNYLPNRLACLNFAKKVLPKILKIYPNIEFHIVGDIKI